MEPSASQSCKPARGQRRTPGLCCSGAAMLSDRMLRSPIQAPTLGTGVMRSMSRAAVRTHKTASNAKEGVLWGNFAGAGQCCQLTTPSLRGSCRSVNATSTDRSCAMVCMCMSSGNGARVRKRNRGGGGWFDLPQRIANMSALLGASLRRAWQLCSKHRCTLGTEHLARNCVGGMAARCAAWSELVHGLLQRPCIMYRKGAHTGVQHAA